MGRAYPCLRVINLPAQGRVETRESKLRLKIFMALSVPLGMASCGDDKPKSGYDTVFDTCMSQPATQEMPRDEQQQYCGTRANDAIYGTGGTSASGKRVNMAEQSNTNAFKMCEAIDSLRDATEPCRVRGTSVVVTMALSAQAAKKYCGLAANEMRKAGKNFEKGWTLQIKSPYSNGNTIAVCNL